MFDLLTFAEAWISFGTLALLEIVLGIDNIVFISILTTRLPASQREKARRLDLTGAFLPGPARGNRLKSGDPRRSR